MPALNKAKGKAIGIACISNLKQLQIGWHIYASDNRDELVRNGSLNQLITNPNDTRATQPDPNWNSWVYGNMNSPPGNTDVQLIKIGLLYPYVKNVADYKCPADRHTDAWNPPTSSSSSGTLTVRSMSLNAWMNPIQISTPTVDNWRIYRKETQIIAPNPANCWVFIDENP